MKEEAKKVLKKLTSRKFIAMLLGVAMGCAMVFGVKDQDVSTVAGAVTSVVSLVYYMFTEGKIDQVSLHSREDQGEGEEVRQEVILEELFKS